jgi:hypothetical protein
LKPFLKYLKQQQVFNESGGTYLVWFVDIDAPDNSPTVSRWTQNDPLGPWVLETFFEVPEATAVYYKDGLGNYQRISRCSFQESILQRVSGKSMGRGGFLCVLPSYIPAGATLKVTTYGIREGCVSPLWWFTSIPYTFNADGSCGHTEEYILPRIYPSW